MTARILGISLAIGWLILPFVACAGAFFFLDDELGVPAISMSAALTLPFIVGTTVYTFIAMRRCIAIPSKRVMPGLFLLSSLLALAVWAIVMNGTSRRITPATVSDSPFDKYWYSAPQSAYGIPFPFLRYFDDHVPDGGYPEIQDWLFDTTALLGNLTIWSFPVFVIVSLGYTVLPPRNDGEPCDATEPGLRGFADGNSTLPAR